MKRKHNKIIKSERSTNRKPILSNESVQAIPGKISQIEIAGIGKK